MQKYHRYVFDLEHRTFLGAFEEMYAAENEERFDSWHERDLRHLRKQICLAILNQYNHDSILELGCGKGTFTHLLKKKNNAVTAIDISHTAIAKATASYPDIDFRVSEVENLDRIPGRFDLGLVMGTFAYVEEWPHVLKSLSKKCQRCLVAEYVPAEPIGFVKSIQELVSSFEAYFSVKNKIIFDEEHCILFGRSKSAQGQ